jgi:hypothetical protein
MKTIHGLRMTTTNWTDFSKTFKKVLDCERYVLDMYSNMPDDTHNEISSFLGSSFKDILDGVYNLYEKQPRKKIVTIPIKPIKYTDEIVLYNIHTQKKTHVLWKEQTKNIKIEISNTFYTMYINNKLFFEEYEDAFQKKYPRYFEYMMRLLNQNSIISYSKETDIVYIVNDFWNDEYPLFYRKRYEYEDEIEDFIPDYENEIDDDEGDIDSAIENYKQYGHW